VPFSRGRAEFTVGGHDIDSAVAEGERELARTVFPFPWRVRVHIAASAPASLERRNRFNYVFNQLSPVSYFIFIYIHVRSYRLR